MKAHLHGGIAYTGLGVIVKAIQLGGKAEPEAIRQGFKKVDYVDKTMGSISLTTITRPIHG